MKTVLNFVVASVCMLTDYTHILVIGIIILVSINIKTIVEICKPK
jgi:hypothetical protein